MSTAHTHLVGTKCPTQGKVCRTLANARKHRRWLNEKGWKVRYYLCPACDHYHITSVPRFHRPPKLNHAA